MIEHFRLGYAEFRPFAPQQMPFDSACFALPLVDRPRLLAVLVLISRWCWCKSAMASISVSSLLWSRRARVM
jgi:hypothetical protein